MHRLDGSLDAGEKTPLLSLGDQLIDYSHRVQNNELNERIVIFYSGVSKEVPCRLEGSLGKGGFSRVHKIWIKSKVYALKVMLPNRDDSSLLREYEVLSCLNLSLLPEKKHIIQMRASCVYQRRKGLIMELGDGDFWGFLVDRGGLPFPELRDVASQLGGALDFIGKYDVVHGDLKPDNIIMKKQENGAFTLKLADFGSAFFKNRNEGPACGEQVFKYRSPEVALGIVPYSHSIDWWALGCILFESCKGYDFLQAEERNEDTIREHEERLGPYPSELVNRGSFIGKLSYSRRFCKQKAFRLQFLGDLSLWPKKNLDEDLFFNLLQKMLEYDPSSRISSSEFLMHPFVSGLRV